MIAEAAAHRAAVPAVAADKTKKDSVRSLF